ncbi:DUF4376 domain-containing protein [Pararhodobacter sp. SW119]|uniref:DUF4376 domain-containing protein n=1 Tax=Pararhodobacter sp. SW119 TaxID=2780075 RepID=UPI001AE09D61|nr:DUF4376 domain-containing protein [Pararhodobacter sp. SW119]
MRIAFSPIRRDGTLSLERAGDTLLLNGTAFDFAPLPEGAMLPPEAMDGDWFAGPVERIAGVLHLALFLPHGRDAAEAARFPAPITVAVDGPIALPGASSPARATRARRRAGKIDFRQVATPAGRRRAEASAERRRIRMRRDLALAAGVMVGSVTVQTDDRAQQRLQAAAFGALRDPGCRIAWKAAGGRFVTLDAGQVIALADAVRAHVQACFDHEARLLAALDAGRPVDPDAGWPGGARTAGLPGEAE